MGKINMGIFYGKKYNPRNRTFSLENGENFIEGTGHSGNYVQCNFNFMRKINRNLLFLKGSTCRDVVVL